MSTTVNTTSYEITASSVAGGPARHFCVQVAVEVDVTGATYWRRYATFAQRGEAERCADQLSAQGHPIRLIAYPCCATAA